MISYKKNEKFGSINHGFDRNYGLVEEYEDGEEKRNSCKGEIVPVAQKTNRGNEFSKDSASGK